jgi:uncharacterized protein Smg (DUF494 family)
MTIVNEYIEHKFYHFLSRWKKRLENAGYDNEEIVNDFMWTENLYGEELFNELLSLIETNNVE